MKLAWLCLFLLGLLAPALALTVRDIHLDTTVVQVADDITPDGVEHVLVEIDHIEDDVSDDGKTLLAERNIRVALRFDVSQDSGLLVNGIPAPFGFSHLTVQAQLFEVDFDGKHVPFDDLISVSVRIFAKAGQRRLENGNIINTILVQERVVGIQQTEVWQADVIQQVFAVHTDRSLIRLQMTKISVMEGEPALQQQGGNAQSPHGISDDADMLGKDEEHKCLEKMKEWLRKAQEWFHQLPFYQRILVSFLGGALVGIVGIVILKALFGMLCFCCGSKKSAKKGAAGSYKENIRVYSLQYTALPTDEKEKKQQPKENQMV